MKGNNKGKEQQRAKSKKTLLQEKEEQEKLLQEKKKQEEKILQDKEQEKKTRERRQEQEKLEEARKRARESLSEGTGEGFERLEDMLQAGLISKEDADRYRGELIRKELNLSPAVPTHREVISAPKMPDTVVQEDPASKAHRELRAVITRMVGTRDEPRLSDELWRALRGDTGNEALRTAIAATIGSTPERERLARLFRDVDCGVIPGVLVGKDEKSVLLRLLVWPFLLSLAADAAANEAKRVSPSLDLLGARQDLFRQMLEAEAGRGGTQVLSLIGSLRASENRGSKVLLAKQAPRGEARAKGTLTAGVCFKCGLKGHFQKDCPKK